MRISFRTFAVVATRPAAKLRARRAGVSLGLRYQESRPDFVLALGGDGTLLWSERLYPGVPKLPVKDSRIAKTYADHGLEDAFAAIVKGSVLTEHLLKLEARIHRGTTAVTVLALNDIIVRNKNLANAMRFSLRVGKKERFAELIGDGLVIATPFGSSAYFHSITRRSFSQGMGVAFNNLTVPTAPIILQRTPISIVVRRGPVAIAADNYTLRLSLGKGDTVIVRAAREHATILHPL